MPALATSKLAIAFPPFNASGISAHNYATHVNFVVQLFRHANWLTREDGALRYFGNSFEAVVRNKVVLFDFSDTKDVQGTADTIFKFHYSREHRGMRGLFPFSPVSFHDWEQYYQLQGTIQYSCNADTVLNNQRAYGNATQRRTAVREAVQKEYGSKADCALSDQVSFWKKMSDCLVSVCVPGQRISILDRGQMQYFAFGGCTISPVLDTCLIRSEVVPGVHYIACHGDFSNLRETIEWCRAHRQDCVTIGRRAKQLFLQNCTPASLTQFVLQSLPA
jgi:hypothetical protein